MSALDPQTGGGAGFQADRIGDRSRTDAPLLCKFVGAPESPTASAVRSWCRKWVLVVFRDSAGQKLRTGAAIQHI